MQSSNPEYYVTGGTLSATADCYVTRQADTDLAEALLRGEICYVLSSRQMGKSSLMVRTAARIREHGGHAVLFDLTAIGSNVTPEQWYLGMLCQFGDIAGLLDEVVEFWNKMRDVGPLQRFVSSLRNIAARWPSGQIVVFIDEVDVVTQLPFSTDDFFAAIRECHNRKATDDILGRLTFCLLGVAVPSDLIQDPASTPFNIGRRVVLTDFTPAEARKLESGLNRKDAICSQLLMDRVIYWTNGHPYMTQRLCASIRQDSEAVRPRDVDRLCKALFMQPEARDSDPNLAFSQRCLIGYSAEHDSIIPIYYRILLGESIALDEADPVHNKLLLSGVIRQDRDYMRVRNRIFATVFDKQWVKAQLPRSEIQIQRFVYVRGIRRGALLTAYIVLLIAIAAGSVFKSRVESQRIALRDAENAYRMAYDYRFVAIVARMNHSGMPVATQTLQRTMPIGHKADLRRFEWYYLNKLCQQGEANARRRTEAINAMGWRRDGAMLAYSDGKTVELWSATAWKNVGSVLQTYGNEAGVNSTVLSPDGTLMAAGRSTGDITMIRVDDNAHVSKNRDVHGHTGAVNSIQFSHSGRKLLSASADGTARIWDVSNGSQLAHFPRTGRLPKRGVWKAAFSPDESLIATAGDDGVARLFRTADGVEIAEFKGHTSYIHSLDFSPNGKLLVTGGGDRSVIVWEIASGRQFQRMFGHTSYVYDVAFSPDGKSVASCGWDRSVRIWDVATGNQARDIPIGSNAWALAFSPDNRWLAVGTSEGLLRVYDAVSDSIDRELPGKPGTDLSLVISKDNSLAISCFPGGAVHVWDVASGALRAWCAVDGGYVASAVSTDGQVIARCSKSNCVMLDPRTGRELRRYPGDFDCFTASLSEDGSILCTVGSVVTLWDTKTGRLLHRFPSPRNAYRLTLSPDATRLVVASEQLETWLYDVSHGHRLIPLEGLTGKLQNITFGQDGVTLVGSGETVKLWDSRTGKLKLSLPDLDVGYMAAAVTRDNTRLFYCTKFGQMRIWDLTTNQALMDLPDVNPGGVNMTVSADGRLAAYQLASGRTHILDTR